jgi:hypothetical protein
LYDGELADSRSARWITKYCYPRQARRDLLEQFQPFPGEAVFKLGKSGDVPARPRHAFDKTRSEWIDHLRKHDRRDRRRFQHRLEHYVTGNKDDLGRERGQFRRQFPGAGRFHGGPSVLDPNVALRRPTQILQLLLECCPACNRFRIILSKNTKNSDTPDPL